MEIQYSPTFIEQNVTAGDSFAIQPTAYETHPTHSPMPKVHTLTRVTPLLPTASTEIDHSVAHRQLSACAYVLCVRVNIWYLYARCIYMYVCICPYAHSSWIVKPFTIQSLNTQK